MKPLALLFLCFFLIDVNAQRSNDIQQSIIGQVQFDTDGFMTVSWIPKEGATSYRIRFRDGLDANWQTVATGVVDSFYVFEEKWDSPVEVSVTALGGTSATTYILAGHEVFEADQEEGMLLIVTDSIYTALDTTIEAYVDLLSRELIQVEVEVVNESTPVEEVKDLVLQRHASGSLDYILLLGHVAVPYSGNSAIDGHTPDHMGAWVADGYYGELDGNWTDFSVNNAAANRDANKNVPGDGKFDQTIFPSEVEVAVGRVDFSNLPKLRESEVELTRRYLERNMAYRQGLMKPTRRAIIDNNFNLGEGFAQGAIKAFHTFLEVDSINYSDYSQCTTQDYLFTYGAGAGNYQGASGIINTDALVNDSIQSVFTTIFGSYFGDWDVSNNVLRAALARGNSLINAWSGRPIWYFHPMAMGKTVGEILLSTQNNSGNYVSQFGNRMCHISLLGDPSLKMYYHEAIDFMVFNDETVFWEYNADDSEVVGYTVYYKDGEEWKLLGQGVREEAGLDYDELPIRGMISLLIRPVGLIASNSGSYYNEGIGIPFEVLLTSTNEIEQVAQIYPNPANDWINIECSKLVEKVEIADMQGRIVKSVRNSKRIPIRDLGNGAYFLLFENKAYPFIKQE